MAPKWHKYLSFLAGLVFIGSLGLTGCTPKSISQASVNTATATPAAETTSIALPVSPVASASSAMPVPSSTPASSEGPTVLPVISPYAALEGYWLDQKYNFKQCMYCKLDISVDFSQLLRNDPGPVERFYLFMTFYDGKSSERQIDAFAIGQMDSKTTGSFAIADEYNGFEADGVIHFQGDNITLELRILKEGTVKTGDLFAHTRTLVKDPYAGVQLADPFELAKRDCEACRDFTFEMETGVDWHEDLFSGDYLDVVNVWNDKREMIRRFIVNRVNGTTVEVDL